MSKDFKEQNSIEDAAEFIEIAILDFEDAWGEEATIQLIRKLEDDWWERKFKVFKEKINELVKGGEK